MASSADGQGGGMRVSRKIRVLVVDDSAVFAKLRRGI
jgi:hypothetical protein